MEENTKIEKKTTAKVKKKGKGLLSYDQYLNKYAPAIDKYARAYGEPRYRGILKSKEEWKKELNENLTGRI